MTLCSKCKQNQVPENYKNNPRKLCDFCKSLRKVRQAASSLSRYYNNHNYNKNRAREYAKINYAEKDITDKIIQANDLLVIMKVLR